jgi:pantoate--beta-alanine ligase
VARVELGELLRNSSELDRHVRDQRAEGRRIVLVPTMGDLHRGHLSLVETAARLGHVVVSVFVNPTQFGPGEDFAAYPRDLEADRAKLAELGVSHSVFAPSTEELYDRNASTWVTVEGLGDPLCGRHRPGHFRGVTTVLAKLFSLVQPDAAVFGEKDAQQCLVVQRMVNDLRMPLRLVFAPTVREEDGLAMSSRNRYLGHGERRVASQLRRALLAAHRLLDSGERSVDRIEAEMRGELSEVGLDYAELRSLPELEHPSAASGHMLAAVAARVGKARLIDNQPLSIVSSEVRAVALSEAATVEAVMAEFNQGGNARKVGHGGSS